jgi:methanogenesis imperfect marker protein 11
MMDVLNPEDIRRKFKDKYWVSPYTRILGMTDGRVVELIEDHSRGTCYGGAAWEVHHYPRTSPLVYHSRRDGARNIFRVKVGQAKLDLVPGLAAAGIGKISIGGDKIRIQYSGLGGAGVAIAMARGQAEGVDTIEVYEWGGGGKSASAAVVVPKHEKIVFGIDDTDNPKSGATWALANEIGYNLNKNKEVHYIGHTINQLFPQNPFKTQNCVSIAISFAVIPEKKDFLKDEVTKLLKKHSDSSETGLAIFTGIEVPQELKRYCSLAKMKMIKIEETQKVASRVGVELVEITGEMGLIGALAALGFYDDPDKAVRVDV